MPSSSFFIFNNTSDVILGLHHFFPIALSIIALLFLTPLPHPTPPSSYPPSSTTPSPPPSPTTICFSFFATLPYSSSSPAPPPPMLPSSIWNFPYLYTPPSSLPSPKLPNPAPAPLAIPDIPTIETPQYIPPIPQSSIHGSSKRSFCIDAKLFSFSFDKGRSDSYAIHETRRDVKNSIWVGHRGMEWILTCLADIRD